MRLRALLALVPALAAGVLTGATPAHATQGPLCNGFPANQQYYVCLVALNPDAADPTISVDTLTVPRFCVVNQPVPLCTPATTVPVGGIPNVTPGSGAVAVVYYDYHCYTFYADGHKTDTPGSVDTADPPMPHCT